MKSNLLWFCMLFLLFSVTLSWAHVLTMLHRSGWQVPLHTVLADEKRVTVTNTYWAWATLSALWAAFLLLTSAEGMFVSVLTRKGMQVSVGPLGWHQSLSSEPFPAMALPPWPPPLPLERSVFTVFLFTYRSVIYLKLIFVWMDSQLFQPRLIRRFGLVHRVKA